MGKTVEQQQQMEALFVPRKGSNHIEFAGIVEASRDRNCDIHGNPIRRGSSKRDSISFPISLSKDCVDKLKKRDSVDREINRNGNVNVDNVYGTVQRRRSSGGRTPDSDAHRYRISSLHFISSSKTFSESSPSFD